MMNIIICVACLVYILDQGFKFVKTYFPTLKEYIGNKRKIDNDEPAMPHEKTYRS